MFVTRSGPSISTQPFVTVDLPAPESPTRQNMIGRPARNGSAAALLIAGLVGPRLEHAARADVRRVDAGEIVAGDGPPVSDEAVRLAQLDAVERVAHAARVGEVRLAHPQHQILAERGPRRLVELVMLLAHHQV